MTRKNRLSRPLGQARQVMGSEDKVRPVNTLIRFLSPSETARSLGVSVKALRVYEAEGLVEPHRTEAGWRVYGPDQMTRLH
jgi:hypothetical protein